jgi:hypothetical protein
MKRFLIIFAIVVTAVLALAQTKAPAQKQSSAILPDVFAGYRKSVDKTSADPAVADPVNAKALAEYGMEQLESANYTRDDRHMSVKAIRFKDASGAYGAFTFYKSPEMQTEKIGDQASSNNNRILFYRGNVLVTVDLDRVTPTSAGDLRELAGDIPLPSANARNLPTLPLFFPKDAYVANSVKYVEGPEALAGVGSPLTAKEIDFSVSPEAAVAQYSLNDGNATLEIVSYPTPAIAETRLKAVEAAHPQDASAGQPFLAKRSGPLLAVVTGPISPRGAKTLLGSVNYDAAVTWNEATPQGKNGNVGSLLVGVIVLVGVILGLAVVAGIAFGGARIVLTRMFPNRAFGRSDEADIIELNLR